MKALFFMSSKRMFRFYTAGTDTMTHVFLLSSFIIHKKVCFFHFKSEQVACSLHMWYVRVGRIHTDTNHGLNFFYEFNRPCERHVFTSVRTSVFCTIKYIPLCILYLHLYGLCSRLISKSSQKHI